MVDLRNAQPEAQEETTPNVVTTPSKATAPGGTPTPARATAQPAAPLLDDWQLEQVGGPVSAAWREGTLTRAKELESLCAWVVDVTPAG